MFGTAFRGLTSTVTDGLCLRH